MWIFCNVVNAGDGVRLENTSTRKGHENCLFLHLDSLFSDIPRVRFEKRKNNPLNVFSLPPSQVSPFATSSRGREGRWVGGEA